jgi:MOSC domain-containing protein YiiM
VLRDIVRRFDNKLALDAEVIRGGLIRVGDPVTLVMKPEHKLSSAGQVGSHSS